MDNSWGSPGPGLCAQRVSMKHASVRLPALGSGGAAREAAAWGSTWHKNPREGSRKQGPKCNVSHWPSFRRGRGRGEEHENSPGSLRALLNGLHFMERNGLVSMQSPFSDHFCQNIFLIFFSITIFLNIQDQKIIGTYFPLPYHFLFIPEMFDILVEVIFALLVTIFISSNTCSMFIAFQPLKGTSVVWALIRWPLK